MDHTTSVLQTLDKLDSYIPRCSEKNDRVSKWSVGMQIEHCLVATRGICLAVVSSKPYVGKINKGLVRRIIFLTGAIPRGRGKAPEPSLPNEETTEARLRELLAAARIAVEKAAESNADCWWEHFMFGVMKRDEALKFVRIHNKHHLKIMSDIVAKAQQRK